MAETDQGQIPVEITEVDGDEVVVDGNHMLAGQTLTFDVEVVALREATEQEIEHSIFIRKADVVAYGDCDHEHGDEKEGCCGGGEGGCGCH